MEEYSSMRIVMKLRDDRFYAVTSRSGCQWNSCDSSCVQDIDVTWFMRIDTYDEE